MKFQVLSDVHLEFRKSLPNIKPKAPYLFLAGDIGNIESSSKLYEEFMDYASKYWRHTFVILGNHEFYSNKSDMDTLTVTYTAFFMKYKNVTLLNNDDVYVDGYRIIGLTLWSHINSSKKSEVMKYINCIDKMHITVEIYNELHSMSVEWLTQNYTASYPKTIIMTHYPTTQNIDTCAPQFRSQPPYLKDVFASKIANTSIKPENDNSILFISGHTHYSFDVTDPQNKNIRYISNQLGYPNELMQFYPYSENRSPLDLLEKVFEY